MQVVGKIIRQFLQKYFSFWQPFALCLLIWIVSMLISSSWGVVLSFALGLFFIIQVLVYGKFFWEDDY